MVQTDNMFTSEIQNMFSGVLQGSKKAQFLFFDLFYLVLFHNFLKNIEILIFCYNSARIEAIYIYNLNDFFLHFSVQCMSQELLSYDRSFLKYRKLIFQFCYDIKNAFDALVYIFFKTQHTSKGFSVITSLIYIS